MIDNSKIEWTDASWNPIRARLKEKIGAKAKGSLGWYCEHATTGCEFCYAEGINKRLGTGLPFKPGHRKDVEIFLDENMLLQPLRWRKKDRMIFVCSMTDLFADFVTDAMIDKIFAVMALSPRHIFQVLTKRAARMNHYLCSHDIGARWSAAAGLLRNGFVSFQFNPEQAVRMTNNGLVNVWLGVSAERQEEWDARKEFLRGSHGAIHFASFEPLLGAIVEPRPMSDYIQWAIVGGESGPKARPMHPDWARSLQDQCMQSGVPFFFKQWGEFCPGILGENWSCVANNPELRIDDPNFNLVQVTRVGKKAAGRLLDGIEHNAMPEVHHDR
jgi:protein gp37